MYVAHICALHFISSDRYPKKKKGLLEEFKKENKTRKMLTYFHSQEKQLWYGH